MSTVFADTFYWIALTTPLDAAHERAKKFTDDIVTIHEVLTEFLKFLFFWRGASASKRYERRAGKFTRPNGAYPLTE